MLMILKTIVGNSPERRHLNEKWCGINYQRHLKSKVFHFLLSLIPLEEIARQMNASKNKR
jgi:hypothetical protein